jgi:hypothetical protein
MQSRRGEVPRAATVVRRLECSKVKEIGQGASAWRCTADGALGEGGERMELQFD